MVDKEIKRKLRRIWCERLVIGLCLPVALGFSVVKVQSVFDLMVQSQQSEVDRRIQRIQFIEMDRVEPTKQARQKLQQELLFLRISAICLIVMLSLLLRQRNRKSLTLISQLIYFFPEECIAELEALRQQLKTEQRSILLIRMILLCTVIELFWAFYIQINIENLWLPRHRKRLVIGLCVLVALGFLIVKVQSVYYEANLTRKANQAQQVYSEEKLLEALQQGMRLKQIVLSSQMSSQKKLSSVSVYPRDGVMVVR